MKARLRRCAEVMLGPLIVHRRLPVVSGHGRITASIRVGGLKFLLKSASRWDPELLRIASLLVKSNDVVWDVGANVGLFSKAAAAHAGLGGRVIAMEADVDAVALLNRTCRYIDPDHAEILVLPVAVGREIGFVRFSIAMRARAANAIEGYGSTQMGGVRETRTLPCVTLDSLLTHFPAPHVLKIDVEGAELDVLDGGRDVLTRIRPTIYCEVGEAHSEELSRLLRSYAYRLFDGSTFDASSFVDTDKAMWNTVAIPEEKLLSE